MNKRFYQGGVLKVELPDKIILLLAPERPASSRSKRAFDEQSWQEVQPPSQGYAQGTVGCQEAVIVARALNRKAPTSQPKLFEEEQQ